MSRRSLVSQAGAALLVAGFLPGFGTTPAHAGTGCTVVAPTLSCMYACVAGERQTVQVVGTDVGGNADCGYGTASCYNAPTEVPLCTSTGSRATFTDVYWHACYASPGSLAVTYMVTCSSAP